MVCVPQLATSFDQITAPTPAAALALLALGLLATGFATVLYFKVIQGPGPAFLSQVSYFVPVWAVFAGAVFLGERIDPSVYLGLGLILSGIAISEFWPRVAQAIAARRDAAGLDRALADKP